MIEGALILLVGVVVGRMLPNRQKTQLTQPEEPYCGCDHHLAMHDSKTGVCHEQVETGHTKPVMSPGRTYVLYRETLTEQCNCRQYVGPIPADQVLASFQPREIA